MKKITLSTIVCIMCLVSTSYAKTKTFKYMQKVKVVAGFYEGCTGVVESQSGDDYYRVFLTCKVDDSVKTLTEFLSSSVLQSDK